MSEFWVLRQLPSPALAGNIISKNQEAPRGAPGLADGSGVQQVGYAANSHTPSVRTGR